MRYEGYRQGNKTYEKFRTSFELVGIGALIGLLSVVAGRVVYDIFPDDSQESEHCELCCPYCSNNDMQTSETLSLDRLVLVSDEPTTETLFK